METTSEAVEPYRDDPGEGWWVPESELSLTPSSGAVIEPVPSLRPRRFRVRSRLRARERRLSLDARRELLWITSIYLAARVLLIIVAVLNDAYGHHDLQGELAHWDGLWYRAVANHGYPHDISYGQTNLGFFPLYPVAIYLLSPALGLLATHDQIWVSTFTGLFISAAGGLVATVFVHRLAEGWWDRETARRATLLFVIFPGSVIFSMVYSEGLLLPFAAVCIWALERRRWMLAGVMAGLGTAVQPVGLVLIAVCGISALRELWLVGGRARSFRMSVLATAMSGLGAVSFMVFLWAWTGTPFATYITQHRGWGEKTDPFALINLVTRQLPRLDPAHFNNPTVNLNDVFGFLGALLMLWELWLLWRYRRSISLPAITWTLGITFFAFTSEYVPPNPRLIITAFPMLMCIARRVRGPRFAIVLWIMGIMLAALSLLTFTAHILRP